MVTRVTDLRNLEGDYRVLDDRMLVLDFQAGHPEAFVEIHRRYGQLARHVCGRLLPNRADADEAFQEAMIRVFQGLHRFNGRYALQPWIARIATNVSLDQIRARTRRPQVEDGAFEEDDRRDPADGPEEAFERLVERDLVLSVLSDLPASHRTALVLRELEGRSHKEIGETLGITPSQAKALIHRAKGSFRRGWLKGVAEKGGLTGIAVLPLLWLARVADHAKRLADRAGGQAGQVAQAATPEIVHTAASSPGMASAATGVTERVIAAGMTLILAGGVTVGAATMVRGNRHRDPADRAAAAPVVTQAPRETAPAAEEPPTAVEKAEDEQSKTHARRNDRPKAEPPVVVAPPVEEPSTSPSPEPGTNPSPDPVEEPDPVVTPPPVPAWTYTFQVSTESVEVCACDGSSKAFPKRVERFGEDEEAFRYTQVIRGGALDASGDVAWPFALQQWGEVSPSGGRIELRFTLESVTGLYLYSGLGTLASTVEAEDGSVRYHFEGTFQLSTPDRPAPGLPTRGFLSASISVWPDGNIYSGGISLLEASA